ncbi:MAG: homoserine kinase [Acidobacteria bacterium]|nr:homoserine kinase [Acidobacteriota bacterium]
MSSSLLGRVIRVPGSTSNLGAGFDALGLALGLYLEVEVVGLDEHTRGGLRWSFAGRPLDGDNYIERGFRALADQAGLDLPTLDLEVTTGIPMKAGLGSSAAAIVAGTRLFEAVAGPRPLQELLDVATALEGHPDNVSASLLGGLTASAAAIDGHVISIATRWPDDWRLVVATPEVPLETRVARAALPERVSLGDAVHNVQRAALLVQAAATASFDALREATRDRLHQPHRAPLVPGLAESLAWSDPALGGVFLSGAGPSIAAIVRYDTERVVERFQAMYRRLDVAATVRVLAAHQPHTC